MYRITTTPTLASATFIFSTLLFLGVASTYWYTVVTANNEKTDTFQVHVLDVGQGSSTLLETADGQQLLIDTGNIGALLRPLGQELGWFDRSIDGLVITHFDADHFGSAIDLVQRYKIGHLYLPYLPDEYRKTVTSEVDTLSGVSATELGDTLATNFTNDYETDQQSLEAELITLVREKNIPISILSAGDSIYLSPTTVVEVLWPLPNIDLQTLPENDRSLVLRASSDSGSSLVITGDASAVIEDTLTTIYGTALEADLLLVGHHGSKTSTATSFVQAVDPDIAIISAGRDNQFGHPHASVTERLKNLAIPIITTAADQSLSFQAEAGRFVFQ